MRVEIPEDVKFLCDKLESAGFEAWVVGGCVRDSLLGRTPKDWDIVTNAKYDEIEQTLKDNVYIVDMQGAKEHNVCFTRYNHQQFEISTFRADLDSLDHRHATTEPVSDIEQDLARRDFTINAMAYRPSNGDFKDLFGGIEDLKFKTIRSVGSPDDRINEDALRILRAYRFACQLGFKIDEELLKVCHERKADLKYVSKERQREELSKVLLSDFKINNEVKEVISLIIPEFEKLIGFEQKNPNHIYTIDEHTLKTVQEIPKELDLRYAALLHDFGKMDCFTIDEKGVGHFYNHPSISADYAKLILKDLKFDNDFIKEVSQLVLYHDRDIRSEKAIKKFLSNHEPALLDKVYQLQIADGLAQNPELALPRVEADRQAQILFKDILNRKEPLTIKDLEINGNDLIKLGYSGKSIGEELNSLLEKVLENPEINNKKMLLEAATKDYLSLEERRGHGLF